MHDLSRRDLLKATAAVGAGAVVLPGIMAGDTPAIAADGSGSPYSAKSPPAKLTGRIVRPGDPGVRSASLGWDELFVRYPLVIVFAQETQDVVNALTWARQHNVALRVRSGRHSLEGWSNVDNGIVIDVSELKSAQIDTATRTATVGAGLNQLEAVTTLAKQNLAVTTGTEGSVGLSGATLGGGLGFLTRYLGMACDSLIGAEIVVASGADGAEGDQGGPEEQLGPALGAARSGKRQLRDRHLTHLPGDSAQDASPTCKRPGKASTTCPGSSTPGSGPHRSPTTASEPSSRSTSPRSCCSRVLADGSEAEAKELLEAVLSVGNPEVTVQTGGWGDIYAGFQIPTVDEPANWKFFSQFTSEPFPKKAVSIIRRFMADAPSEDSNFFAQAFGTGRRRANPTAARRSRIATRSSTPSPALAGELVESRTAATPPPRSPKPGSPSSARHCGPT